MSSGPASRVLAIWCMDWPAVAAAAAAGLAPTVLPCGCRAGRAAAAAAAAGLAPTVPVGVTRATGVIACSASARAAGVRRGLRRREAQARCPELHVVTADPARDARHFEGVTA